MKKVEVKNTAGDVVKRPSMQVKKTEIANNGHRWSVHFGAEFVVDESPSK